MPPLVNDHLLYEDGTVEDATRDAIAAARASGKRFWLDLIDIDGEDAEVLTNEFALHPLAVEDAEHFGQRPKLDEYGEYVYLVVFGVHEGVGLIEVHIVYSERWVITIRRGECHSLDLTRDRAARRASSIGLPPAEFLYRIVDGLVDSFFPVLERFDDQIDVLEDEILRRPTEAQLGVLFDMKRTLVSYRRAVTPQRDVFAKIASGAVEMPGLTIEDERYFRDVYDHLIRISDLIDSYRDLLTGAMDTHLSTVSNRLNGVMKQLTIIATIFLPLTFLTGFFGQNFGWLVARIGRGGAFLGLGLGLDAVAVVGLLAYFRRRRWL
jgi:magnesium transporter